MKKIFVLMTVMVLVCSAVLSAQEVGKRGEEEARRKIQERILKDMQQREERRRIELKLRMAAKRGEAEIEKELKDITVSFSFQNQRLSDAVSFLSTLTRVNIVVDPRLNPQDVPVTLKVQNMSAFDALTWIAKSVGAKMEIKQGAVYLYPGKDEALDVSSKLPRRFRIVGRLRINLSNATTLELDVYESDFPEQFRKKLISEKLEPFLRGMKKELGNKKPIEIEKK